MTFSPSDPLPPAPLHRWWGPTPPDRVVASIERTRRLDDVQHVAVMPDVHLAHGVCVGTVFATARRLYPGAVGGDLGCGMAALGFDAGAEVLAPGAVGRDVLMRLSRVVPIQRHAAPLPVAWGGRRRLSDSRLDRVLHGEALHQLGTLGGGNHFLELQRDTADNRLWLMVHSGSRGLGQAVSRHHLARCADRSRGLHVLDAASPAGRAFWRDLRVARAWARLNRWWMVQAVVWLLRDRLGVEPLPGTFVQCDHNHIRREWHVGPGGLNQWYIHRKGAAPAHAGRRGLIPGSMGTPSYHVVGRGHAGALCSSAHGAGRAMSRSEARRVVSTGGLRRAIAGVHVNPKQLARLREEAPQAYKGIGKVMRYQRELVRVERELQPVLSYKGG